MPANPRNLYDALVDAGELSVSYEDFRQKWAQPEWNIEFYKALRRKELTSLTYNDFTLTFSDEDPDYKGQGETIELSEEELVGKPQADGEESGESAPSEWATAAASGSSGTANSWASYLEAQSKKKDSIQVSPKQQSKINNVVKDPVSAEAAVEAVKRIDNVGDYVEKTMDESTEDEYTVAERAGDAFGGNMIRGFETAWESTKALVAHVVAEAGMAGGPGHTLAKIKKGEYLKEQLAKVEAISDKMVDTGSLVEGIKEGDFQEFAGGAFNATQGVLSTVIPAMLTGGASLAPQVIAPIWTDYQITKAHAKYGESEDPIAALIDNNDIDNAAPLAIGAGALVLEKMGFKGITKYMAGTKAGRKMMGIDASKIAWMMTANKEGGTEFLQMGLEEVNTGLASGKTVIKATEDAMDKMWSQDGLETYLQGAFGSGVITAPSGVKRKIDNVLTRALRSDPEGHATIIGGIDAIHELNEKIFNTKSKTAKKTYKEQIKVIEKEMGKVVKKNNKIIQHLSPQEESKLQSILKQKDKIAEAKQELQDEFDLGDITAKEKGSIQRGLTIKDQKLSTEIAELKANVDMSRARTDIKLAQKLAKNMPDLTVDSYTETADVRTAIEDAVKEDGSSYTAKELDGFAKNSAGLFWTDADGKDHIVVNESIAKDAKVTTTSQHEFLHKVLSSVLKADPKLAEVMGDAIDRQMKVLSKQGKLESDSVYEARVKSYEEDGAQIQAEEKLTLLSEALTNKNVQIDDDPKSTFGKLAELIRRQFLDMGITSVNLDGKGVLQFIKDYNREFARGKLSKATEKVLAGETKVKSPSKQKADEAADLKAVAKSLVTPSAIKKSMNTAADITWSTEKDEVFGAVMSTNHFKIGSQTFSMILTQDTIDGSWQQQPGPMKVGELTFNNMTSGRPVRSLTGTAGNASKVMGTIVNGTLQAIEENNLTGITFTANDEGRRAVVYGAIARKIANDMGWRLSIEPDYGAGQTRFVAYKPKGSLKQSKSEETASLYEKTEALYDPTDKHTSGFMIAMEWENQIKSLSRKYKNLPGYAQNVEDLVAYVMTANQGVVGLVNSYKEGKKTEDGENVVSLPGWINKYLPNYVNSALHKHGIGEVEGDGGFAVDVTEVKDLASSEQADDFVKTDEQLEVEDRKKYPRMRVALDLENNKDTQDYLEKKVSLNISSAISLYGKAKTINTKGDAFIKAVKKGIQDDEKGGRVIKAFIKKQGYEEFLSKNKKTILGNYTTTILAKHPFYRQAVQKRIKGVWTSPQSIIVDGKVKYEWLMADNSIYPGTHKDFDRDKKAKTGHTAGHIKIRRHPSAENTIPTNAFIDYHFTDGAGRKYPKANALESMSMQFASEAGFEILEDQLLAREGSIFDAFESRVSLTSEMTEDEKNIAIENGLIIREGMAEVLSDRAIAETLKDLDRGGIKQSKVNKTGFNWFDRPRIDMTNYLAGLESNSVREGVVDGSIVSPDYQELKDTMKDAYDMYLAMSEYASDWTEALQKYAEAFKDKNYSFEDFIQATLKQTTNSIDGVLGLDPGATAFGKQNTARIDQAKKEGVEAFMNDRLNEATDKGQVLADLIKTLVGSTSGSYGSALYVNTPGFYKDVVEPMINAHGIPAGDFRLATVETGTTITYKGNKITTDFSKGVYSKDTFKMFDDLVTEKHGVDNNIDVEGRIAEAKESARLYMDYVEWLKDNYKRMSPASVGLVMKGFQARGRSIAQVMHPTTKALLTSKENEITGYTTMPSIPANYVGMVSLNYIMTGKNKAELNKVVKDGTTAILPRAQAKIVDQFHHNDPTNDFNSNDVSKKLYEVGLPAIKLTDLTKETFVPIDNAEDSSNAIRFSKTIDGFKATQENDGTPKGISVWDFDDTLAKTKSRVRYTAANGKILKLTPAQFAEQGDELMAQGVVFDFSEFSKVVKGKKGPLFNTAVKRNEKFGNEHVYVLTARPQNSAHAIHEFLKGIGLDIRLENITGLQNSDPQAKADWIVGKVGEGYNDFYFADDHIGNVQAVRDVLKSADVKSDVVQAKIKQSKALNDDFQEMLERVSGVKGLAKTRISKSDSRLTGKAYDRTAKARTRFFVPPAAEDFVGLLYKFMGKGKAGDADKNWIMTHLVDPYLRGVEKLDIMNTAINKEYNKLMKDHPVVKRMLYAKVPGTAYTYDMAIRYYLYERSGYGDMMKEEVSAKSAMAMMKAVMTDKKMRSFADALSKASKQPEGYSKPDPLNWEIQSIATDFKGFITNTHRKTMLKEFVENTDLVFTTEVKSKIRSVYGTDFIDALEGSIKRMKTGRKSRGFGDKATEKFFDWINGAIAPIMFLNQRSAILQLLSATNFVNWTDNNPLMIAKAMSNPKQIWKDAVMIINSPKMVQRRDGLRFSIEEAELANIGGSDGIWNILKKRLIKVGFSLTQAADATAIAAGGATMYRNRVNTYLKAGKDLKTAEAEAWKDFAKISDEAQQSSDQMLTSAEQAGGLGRIILAFGNTPAQYTRLMKKAALDIKNGRGDLKTNVSKIVYYGGVQNMLFSILQSGVFALHGAITGDEEEEPREEQIKQLEVLLKEAQAMKDTENIKHYKAQIKELEQEMMLTETKQLGIINSMLDSILRGLGKRGAVAAGVKNALKSWYEQSKKPMPNFAQPVLALGSISPPLGSKLRDFNKIMTNEKYNSAAIASRGWGWDSPRWLSVGLGVKASTNMPLVDWVPKKLEIYKLIMEDNATQAQDALLGLGWSGYDIGVSSKDIEQIKIDVALAKKENDEEITKANKEDLEKIKANILKNRTPKEIKRDERLAKEKQEATNKKAADTKKRNKRAQAIAIYEEAQEYARKNKNN